MMKDTYTATIRTIMLGPAKIDKVQTTFDTFDEADAYVKDYLRSLPDVKGTDLVRKYGFAVKRYLKSGMAPSVYSHPSNGVVLRHLITITKTSPCFTHDEDMDRLL